MLKSELNDISDSSEDSEYSSDTDICSDISDKEFYKYF